MTREEMIEQVMSNRSDWTTQDFKDSYEDEWDDCDFNNTPVEELRERMEDYISNTYDTELLIEILED